MSLGGVQVIDRDRQRLGMNVRGVARGVLRVVWRAM